MKKTFYLCLLGMLMLFGRNAARAQSITTAQMFVDSSCMSSSGVVNITGCISGLKLLSYYGDGTMDSLTIFCMSGGATLTPAHVYATAGTYTVKHVLKNNFTRFDSAIYSHEFIPCSHIWLEAWADLNSNCVLDAADHGIVAPGLIRVDSAGVPVDTIPAYCSYDYRAYGPPGTIYKFTAVVPPAGMVSCPSMDVIYDTIPMFPSTVHIPKYWLLQCGSASGFDLGISATFRPANAGPLANRADILVYNSACTGTATTVKFEFGPKFSYTSITPAASHTVVGTSVLFDAGTISSTTPKMFTVKVTPVAALTIGDTVNTKYTVLPTTSDTYPANNIVVRCDTVRAAYDPNQKSVTPTGNITAGQRLEYLLEFENTGTDTAYNIHIMDTLSNYLDVSTMVRGASTHTYMVSTMTSGGSNILKFDFPNILLPDTTHHADEICRGMVTFTINAKTTLTPGTTIANRVGIYFDVNPVVMTNTVYSKIPLPVTGVQHAALTRVELYPNPVSETMNIRTDGVAYATLTIYNMTGQALSTQDITKAETTVATGSLAPGIYYVVLKGMGGSKAIKFEKQ
ncbi:hypothetical protein GCM10023093_29870 [Nemorincola caseinilytica]|uniref:T9SS type A sorting domain-containing protein n=1 Tax=Nemorincola caseinilytica TaxID=2054315 RepID=A0ABP8NML9_9BACT